MSINLSLISAYILFYDTINAITVEYFGCSSMSDILHDLCATDGTAPPPQKSTRECVVSVGTAIIRASLKHEMKDQLKVKTETQHSCMKSCIFKLCFPYDVCLLLW